MPKSDALVQMVRRSGNSGRLGSTASRSVVLLFGRRDLDVQELVDLSDPGIKSGAGVSHCRWPSSSPMAEDDRPRRDATTINGVDQQERNDKPTGREVGVARRIGYAWMERDATCV